MIILLLFLCSYLRSIGLFQQLSLHHPTSHLTPSPAPYPTYPFTEVHWEKYWKSPIKIVRPKDHLSFVYVKKSVYRSIFFKEEIWGHSDKDLDEFGVIFSVRLWRSLTPLRSGIVSSGPQQLTGMTPAKIRLLRSLPAWSCWNKLRKPQNKSRSREDLGDVVRYMDSEHKKNVSYLYLILCRKGGIKNTISRPNGVAVSSGTRQRGDMLAPHLHSF